MSRLTIAICVRDAASTIERAVASCLPEPDCALLLVDDHCADDSVGRAIAVAGSRLDVIRLPAPGGLSRARQAALERIGTKYAAWLDADDEWVPGRARRLVAMMEAGCDVAVDAIDLVEGGSGRWVRRLDAPRFLARPGGVVRLFERNALPGDTQAGFRVSAFRNAGGFDPGLQGPESYDVLLRVIRGRGRFAFTTEIGYRMHAYPASLSRDVLRSRSGVASVLRKHDDADILGLFLDHGFERRIAQWALVAVAMFRGEPARALSWLEALAPEAEQDTSVLEPDGPWPVPERWRFAFYVGTATLMRGDRGVRAIDALDRAERLLPTPEGANNLGVALAREGDAVRAKALFESALRRFPGYRDASLNAAGSPIHVTAHPLRRWPSRDDYPVARGV